jgi:SAM-dependent methyltransferase
MRMLEQMSCVFKRIHKVVNSRILKLWGSTSKKKSIWDEEFSAGQWDRLENTSDDPIYFFLEKYCNGGRILDLGCGSGNTGNEMSTIKYDKYTGVDISESAIQRALARSERNCREEKNEYVCADISLYAPKKRYDIILFRESIFYIPKSKIGGVLDRYRDYLKETGVFIVSMRSNKQKSAPIVRLIERHYHVMDRSSLDNSNDVILVFR